MDGFSPSSCGLDEGTESADAFHAFVLRHFVPCSEPEGKKRPAKSQDSDNEEEDHLEFIGQVCKSQPLPRSSANKVPRLDE